MPVLSSYVHNHAALSGSVHDSPRLPESELGLRRNDLLSIVGKFGGVLIWRFGGLGKNRLIEFCQY